MFYLLEYKKLFKIVFNIYVIYFYKYFFLYDYVRENFCFLFCLFNDDSYEKEKKIKFIK